MNTVLAMVAILCSGGVGLYGMHKGIQYSGWMIFIAVIIALSVNWSGKNGN
jgi:hypothetical protein